MTQFKVGDRVRVKETGQEGIVRDYLENVPDSLVVRRDSGVTTYYRSEELAHVAVKTEPVPTEPVPFYLLLVDGTDIIWSRHNTLEEARKAGNDLLVAGNSEKGVSVLRVIEYGKLPAREIEWRVIE